MNDHVTIRQWTDRNDNKRKAVEVVAEEVFFAEPKRDKGRAPERIERTNKLWQRCNTYR